MGPMCRAHFEPVASVEVGLRNGPGRVDEPDMAEGLGEIAQEFSAVGIDLLGEQADVVDERGRPLEDGARPPGCPARARA